MLHLENLGKVMDSSIKENLTHVFGDNGLLMSFKNLAKVNGLGIFDPHPLPLLMDSYWVFFSQKRSYKSENSKKKGVKFII